MITGDFNCIQKTRGLFKSTTNSLQPSSDKEDQSSCKILEQKKHKRGADLAIAMKKGIEMS